MTRINAHIPPKKLIDQHLIAEYREIVRIPNHVKKNVSKTLNTIKNNSILEFKLGTGHVIFFYDKIKFLHNRYLLLKEECNIRGIETNMDDSMFDNIPDILYNDWDFDKNANKLVVERILERISTMKGIPKYYKKQIDLEIYKTIIC